ncbi:FHA domain-containing protein [Candidatus Sumerlaeota bacterium]|nr:FHA domain-containing protein [Candidatus Sumerlaeota bacterium]
MPDITITSKDLEDPRLDELIALEKSLQRQGDGAYLKDIKTPFYLNPMFYYCVAGTVLAFLAWLINEPMINENYDRHTPEAIDVVAGFLLFMLTAGFIGLGLGMTYGIANHNLRQSVYCSAVGFGVGLIVAIPLSFLANIVFGILTQIVFIVNEVKPDQSARITVHDVRGMAFALLLSGRGLAWAIVAPCAGMGLGVALRSRKVLTVGLVGALVGGGLGGLFFDPVDRFLNAPGEDGWLSRLVGITTIGLLVGLFTGYFENLSRISWLQMIKGPLAGKQFNLYKSPMILGSSPKADIYLFKDPDVDVRHASITAVGAKFMLKDLGSRSGIFVNGNKVDKKILQKGDVVTVGTTVLKFDEKEKR